MDCTTLYPRAQGHHVEKVHDQLLLWPGCPNENTNANSNKKANTNTITKSQGHHVEKVHNQFQRDTTQLNNEIISIFMVAFCHTLKRQKGYWLTVTHPQKLIYTIFFKNRSGRPKFMMTNLNQKARVKIWKCYYWQTIKMGVKFCSVNNTKPEGGSPKEVW